MTQVKVEMDEKTADPNEKILLTCENGGATVLQSTNVPKDESCGSGKIIWPQKIHVIMHVWLHQRDGRHFNMKCIFGIFGKSLYINRFFLRAKSLPISSSKNLLNRQLFFTHTIIIYNSYYYIWRVHKTQPTLTKKCIYYYFIVRDYFLRTILFKCNTIWIYRFILSSWQFYLFILLIFIKWYFLIFFFFTNCLNSKEPDLN